MDSPAVASQRLVTYRSGMRWLPGLVWISTGRHASGRSHSLVLAPSRGTWKQTRPSLDHPAPVDPCRPRPASWDPRSAIKTFGWKVRVVPDENEKEKQTNCTGRLLCCASWSESSVAPQRCEHTKPFRTKWGEMKAQACTTSTTMADTHLARCVSDIRDKLTSVLQTMPGAAVRARPITCSEMPGASLSHRPYRLSDL